jgi:hypothetical protein
MEYGIYGIWDTKVAALYPLVIYQFAIENHHRNSEFSHEKWLFSIVMLNYQNVTAQQLGETSRIYISRKTTGFNHS